MNALLRRSVWPVFVLVLVSAAYFWQSRDWNTSTRLMLTYAIVDRGTIQLDGLHNQTGDIATFNRHYYIDKLPGFSILATIPYALAKWTLRLPDHPLDTPEALAHWSADYWVTLGTSGLSTALTAALVALLAVQLGCRPVVGFMLGLAYGLATPAVVYATLAYGHQLSALALLGSFLLIRSRAADPGRISIRMIAAGFLAAYASLIELQVGPASAILGIYLMAVCATRRRPVRHLGAFIVGTLIPTMTLLVYNQLAFGSPLEMGYFHHATRQFAEVHNKENPLGLRPPNWALVGPLLFGSYRGLLFYAPILVLAIPGWIALLVRRLWAEALVSLAIVGSLFAVNLSYPEWTGGWSTGPRLLLPLIPFAMIPIAGLLGIARGRALLPLLITLPLMAAGYAVNMLFLGVGGRIPNQIEDPLREVVLPLWRGEPLPPWWTGGRFCWNLTGLAMPDLLDRLPSGWQWVQMAPLIVLQLVSVLVVGRWLARTPLELESTEPSATKTMATGDSDLVVDRQEDRGSGDQNPSNPEAQPEGVLPDAGP